MWNTGTSRLDVKRSFKQQNCKRDVDAGHWGGSVRSSVEFWETGWSKGAESFNFQCETTSREDLMKKVKPFEVNKRLVAEAWKRVKANRGSAGVDGVSLEKFEENLENNLYKIWNRMSSGSYFPPPVKVVEIPKSDGSNRRLGIPAVGDRVAQTVVKLLLENKVDKYFHPNSYGYRPGKCAHQALATAREKCWKFNWVIDLDIKGFFDNLDHDLVIKAVEHHIQDSWVILYIQRWLEAPVQEGEFVGEKRTKGSPQGGVISPLLANLFMHYAFDMWMVKNYPGVSFERYADDVIVHCVNETQAKLILERIGSRMRDCGLSLHPEKTKIVYCKDGKRRKETRNTSFDFLGFTFRRRSAKGPYGKFLTFLPAISDKAVKRIGEFIRTWGIPRVTHLSLRDIAENFNSHIQGWINYYGKFYRSHFWKKVVNLIVRALEKWVVRKYKSMKRAPKKARQWLREIRLREPQLFAHWKFMTEKGGR